MIMDVKSLMIGDWVFVNSPSHRVEPHSDKVFSISYDHNQCRYYVETDNYNGIEDYISPIFITKDILKVNGWSEDGYTTLKINDFKWLEYYRYESRLRMWYKGIDEWDNHAEAKEIVFQCECRYVHEMQHALRLCGLEELADNFKI